MLATRRSRLIAGLLALGGIVTWLFFSHGPDRQEHRAGVLSGPERAVLETEPDDQAAPPVALVAEEAETTDQRQGGIYYQPEPDTLVALRGRVVDEQSGLPVAGIELSFLSRRPRTISVHTDEQGWYDTGLELSSGLVSVLHMPESSHRRFSARWNIEPGQFLLAPDGPSTRELNLRVRAPERILEVDVRAMDGTPAALSSVSLTRGTRGVAGRIAMRRMGEGREARRSLCALPTTAFLEMPRSLPISAVESPSFQSLVSSEIRSSVQSMPHLRAIDCGRLAADNKI